MTEVIAATQKPNQSAEATTTFVTILQATAGANSAHDCLSCSAK
jgi:hypothetical protein